MWRSESPAMTEEQFRLVRDVVHRHCGLWFRDDLRYLVERRLGPRLQAHALTDFGAYYRYLRYAPGRDEELEEAVELLTTNETYFCREPNQLRAFSQEILPRVAAALGRERRFRVLSAGCSTGEEAYTIAMLAQDSGLFEGWDVEVVGCDLSRRCVAHARGAAYGEHAFRTPESEAIRRWFQLRGGRWVVDDAIRRLVRFGRVNLLDPDALAGLGRVDAIFCRNVMIYFDVPARRQVLRRFHGTLRDGGWLLLGHSESLVHLTADFEMVHLEHDLVYRKPAAPGAER